MLTDVDQLQRIKEASLQRPQIIYKHSTRCGISSVVLKRLEKTDAPEIADYYFLDLIKHRDVSNQIAELFQVHHESPQILLIKNGDCVFDDSHYSISMDDITEQLASL